MADIGKFNTLEIIADTEAGLYLNAGKLGEILLPKRYVPENAQVGEKLKVFIYLDSEDRFIATTETPKAQVDEFAALKVKATNKMGAFMDWGLSKDLLVPFNQQKQPMAVGQSHLVRVYLDPYTDRLAASTKIDRYLDIWPASYKQGEQVDLIIANKTDLGYKAIINNNHWGLIYANEVFQRLHKGKKLKGYIKQVREDGRIDLTLSRAGKGKVIDFSQKLIAHLEENNGYSPLHDKSTPEQIQKILGVSKKTFKSTVGNLLKKGKLELVENGIKLK